VHPNITSTIHTFSLHSSDSLPSPTRPSLDRVASRSELRTPSSHTHHNHTQSHNRPHSPRRLSSFQPTHPTSAHHQRQLYDHLPSSPLYPPTSPPTPLARDFLDFGKSTSNAKTRRTLEWACEAARIADRDKERSDKDRACCTSAAVISGNHRHHAHHAHQIPHQQPYASTEAFTTSRTYTYSSSSARGRAVHHDRGAKDHQHQNRQPHRKESTRESARDRLTRPSSSLTLRGKGSLSSISSSTRGYTPRAFQDDQGDMTDSEVEEYHEAITPPSPSISNRWSTRLTKTSTNISLTSSSSTSTTPSTSTSISREGSTTSTNTSFTSISSVEDDAMFKAAIALCGLGRMGHGQTQNSMQRRA